MFVFVIVLNSVLEFLKTLGMGIFWEIFIDPPKKVKNTPCVVVFIYLSLNFAMV